MLQDGVADCMLRLLGAHTEAGVGIEGVQHDLTVQLMVATTLVLLCTRSSPTTIARFAPWLLPVPAIAMIGREVTPSHPSSNRQIYPVALKSFMLTRTIMSREIDRRF